MNRSGPRAANRGSPGSGGAQGRPMKPVAFAYARPASVAEAARMLAAEPGARVLAGGQTLGPILNLRLAQPVLLIDIARIPELATVGEGADGATIGATVTHAAIEDGRVPDPTGGFLARVARGIAYRSEERRVGKEGRSRWWVK